ncbi:RING-type E3 ubiquitin transferase [Trifolium repens]|nr:RING-type E3 ubiquitin transferase [Trifolium repens]
MAEMGESSASAKPSDEIWAKLVQSDSRYLDVEIRSDEGEICSEISATSSDKHSWCKIARNSDLCSATMENKSSNTILVDGAEVGNGDTAVIKDGSEIIPGPDREGFVSYKFQILSSPETSQTLLKICVDVDHAKCSICLNIWHDVVTVAPCLHNFCNGCFSEWLRRSQEKRSTVLCPQCRAVVQFVGKNHFLRTIAEDMVRADSSLRRSHDEVVLLDTYASVRSNLVIGSAKKSRKRANTSTPTVDQSDGRDHHCLQCVTAVGGYKCNLNTVHLQCQACGGMMPSRNGLGVPQYCLGCDRPFCGAYWNALGITRSSSYPVCSQDTLKPISEYTISGIPLIVHEKNLHEQKITESCIRQMGRTLQDVISEWIVKLNNKEIDTTRMTLNHAEMMTAGTLVCSECYHKLVSFLLYWFRISIPNHLLPPEASVREDCWYGYACRTQHRNEEHARKRNHVCRPTRGSHF